MRLKIGLVAMIVAACIAACSPTDPLRNPPYQAILLVAGFSGVDTLTLDASTGVPLSSSAGFFNLSEFDSVEIRFTATPMPAGKGGRLAAFLGVNSVLSDSLTAPQSYVRIKRNLEILRPDSVVVLFTVMSGRIRFSNYALLGWQRYSFL
jgi:hypothetical protein